MPWSGENVSFTAYSGLVPMSPKTTPRAASVRAALPVLLRESWSGISEGSAQATPAPHKLQRFARLLLTRLPSFTFGGEVQVDQVAQGIRIGLAHLLHHWQRLFEGLDDRGVEL